MRPIWRQFKPSVVHHYPVATEIYKRAQVLIDQQPIEKRRMWQKRDYSQLDQPINVLLGSPKVESLIAALVLQAPRAVAAQRRMDDHPHGFHDKQARLYELIAFNDTYVSMILLLEDSYYTGVNDQLKFMMDRFCKRVKSPCFDNRQWEAITHGLSREIASFRAIKELGYDVSMTSRQQDAMGVDMVAINPRNGLPVNFDIKTRSSFHFRLKDLASEGRISEVQREAGEHAGFCRVINGHGEEQVHTTLLRIDEETYGQVQDFKIDRLDVLKEKLDQIMAY
ncbi:MAG: hypothetical protein ABIQ64_03915 [Candidatus Saccharimonadales bacterium]